jgi:hypothetical protein
MCLWRKQDIFSFTLPLSMDGSIGGMSLVSPKDYVGGILRND